MIAHFKELLRCIKFVLDTKNRMLCYEVEKPWKVKDFSNFILRPTPAKKGYFFPDFFPEEIYVAHFARRRIV